MIKPVNLPIFAKLYDGAAPPLRVLVVSGLHGSSHRWSRCPTRGPGTSLKFRNHGRHDNGVRFTRDRGIPARIRRRSGVVPALLA
jgi:hypothetical protein